jgi:predicted metal-dependent hydrolase
MPKIILNNQTIDYEVRRSRQARRLRLTVRSDASVVLTLPWHADAKQAEKFVKTKAAWLAKHVAYYQKHAGLASLKLTRSDYLKHKRTAWKLVKERVIYFNRFYKFKVNRLTVKNQKTRWGSCSRQGNLNFNFKLIFLPPVLADYIIVHELCHLQELNHSQKFWALVAKTMPNYKLRRRDLKRAGIGLL